MKYQHVADVVVEFYSCVICVMGVNTQKKKLVTCIKSWLLASKATRIGKWFYTLITDPHTQVKLLGFESAYQHLVVNWLACAGNWLETN